MKQLDFKIFEYPKKKFLNVKKGIMAYVSMIFYMYNSKLINIIPGLIKMLAFDWSMTRWYKTHATGW
jgi:hypothetical protein